MPRLPTTWTNEPQRIVAALWPLALLTPFVSFLPRPAHEGFNWRQELALASLLSLAFALLLRRRSAHNSTPAATRAELKAAAPLAAFAAWGAASALWAAGAFAPLHYSLTWVAYLLFFLLAARAAASPRALRVSLALLGVVVAVIAAANIVGHLGSPHSLLRHNGLGEPLAVSIPLFASLALRLRRRRVALLCGLAAVSAWLCVLQIAERASFIAVCAGLLVLAAAAAATPRFRPRGLARPALLCLALLACLAVQYMPSPFAQSKHQPVLARLGSTSTEDVNARARFLYWAAALEMSRARPLTGVGAGNFDAGMPEARAAFAARRPESPLPAVNEKFMAGAAHNEYLQILAELGVVGFALFAAFCATLVRAAWRALRVARGPLAPGAVASLAVFAVSSGASAVSFRWMGSGLVFFFAAALVTRLSAQSDEPTLNATAKEEGKASVSGAALRLFDIAARPAVGLALSLAVVCVMAAQAAHVQLLAAARRGGEPARAESLYRASLAVNPFDAAAHYQFGLWLYHRGREPEAAGHLRYAVERGFNTSTCFAYLAGAEAGSGDEAAAARTLARAARAFPRSAFVRARYAAALARAGRAEEAELEMAAGLLIDSRTARSWRKLIDDDVDAASEAARRDPERF